MPALAEIVAGAMEIVRQLMQEFVTVDKTTLSADNCGIVQYNALLTGCGDSLVDQLAQLVYSGVQLGAELLGALMVIPGTA